MTRGGHARAADVLRVPVTLFRDTTDTIPQDELHTYPDLVDLLAPERAALRDDVTLRIRKQERLLDDLVDAALAGRRDLDHRWLRLLEKAAIRARAGGADDVAAATAIREKATTLRDDLRKQAKGTLPCWTPAIYRPNSTRGTANIEAVTCLVLDFDDGTAIDNAVAPWSC